MPCDEGNIISTSHMIVGHCAQRERLRSMIASGRLPHCLLISGVEGIGKRLVARELAGSLLTLPSVAAQLEYHPDFHLYRPEGKLALHSAERMRELRDQVALPAYHSGWKVFLVEDAERMGAPSSNALLKTLEEPTPRTLIILLSHFPARLLATVRSRAQWIALHPLPTDHVVSVLKHTLSLPEEQLSSYARRSEGSPGRALQIHHYEATLGTVLAELFSHAPYEDYFQIRNYVQRIAEAVAHQKPAPRKEQQRDLSPAILDAYEKLAEGEHACRLTESAEWVFELLWSWYRDLQVLAYGCGPEECLLWSHRSMLVERFQRGEWLSLDVVKEAIEETRILLQRATPFSDCLEALFLRLLQKGSVL